VGSLSGRREWGGAFTLLELLIVIAIISALTAILIPVVGNVRRQARAVVGMGNLRQIAAAANCFALDNDNRYPPSVATVGFGDNWNWQEPTMLTSYQKRSPRVHRSMSAYMRHYISDASTMFCPSAPREYRYLQEAWEAGDAWVHPETEPLPDPMFGVYCFYWNYTGLLGRGRGLFRGPMRPAGGYGQSKLLVSDYFGYDHWRSRYAYGSCEKLNGADITEGTPLSSDYWSRWAADGEAGRDYLGIELHAAYTDGHVGSYSASETFPMKVIQKRETNEPYEAGVGPGDFYLPRESLVPIQASRR
jgi:prepilin-type N-terminal cleavage/methylation domain-containing protein